MKKIDRKISELHEMLDTNQKTIDFRNEIYAEIEVAICSCDFEKANNLLALL